VKFAHLQNRIFGVPLAIQQSKLEAILAVLAPRFGMDLDPAEFQAASGFVAADKKGYSITRDGIAVIPIQGTLMKKTSGLMAMSGCTSYESIGAQIKDAINSSQVQGVLLDIDSPGGECHGCFELSDLIYSLRGKKPIYAAANDCAASAAYALASAADKVFVTRTGGVGSIGVFCLHVDQSGMDAKDGLKYTYIKAGAKKTEGNPHEPLSDSALKDAQAEVDRERGMFVELVARNRGESANKIDATEAGMFYGDAALELLADEIGTCDDALAALVKLTTTAQRVDVLNNSAQTNQTGKKTQMAKKTNNAEATEDLKTQAIETALNVEANAADEEEMKDDECAVASVDPDDADDKEDEDDDTKASVLTRIVNLCTLAGKSELAASFIGKNMSVKQVEQSLLEIRTMKSNETKVNTTLKANGSGINVDSLQEQAENASNGDPKKALATFKALLAKNPNAYVDYQETKAEAMVLPSTRRKYIEQLEAKYGARVA
jgi:signal peptide peptidase SppA